jgi:ubiquinone/menaquinone biosynthesis C-methylase UbiE
MFGHLVMILAAALLADATGAAPSPTTTPPTSPRHRDEPGRDQFRNPRDLKNDIAAQEEPARAAWQKPDEVLGALHLRPGQAACDIGAGPGYFTLRLARAVTPGGHVFAVDVEPKILDALRDRLAKAGARNVTPVLGLGDDPLLPAAACDLILIVDTYHHFRDGAAYLRRLRAALRPGGRLVNVDFHKRATPLGPPLAHRLAREDFLRDAEAAGFRVIEEPTFLENQYFLVLSPAPAP